MRNKSNSFLLDSNVLIYYMTDSLAAQSMHQIQELIQSEKVIISMISYIECLSVKSESEAELNEIRDLMESLSVMNLTSEVAETTIRIRQALKMKLPDAVVAATALVEGCPIITNDLRSFHQIRGLEVLRAELKV